jgi:hypothetical protein
MPSLILNPVLTDKELEDREGDYFPEEHYKKIIKKNTDVYGYDDLGNKILLLKFRKNVIPQDLCVNAFHALVQHAQKRNYNRGAASGKLNIKKLPSYARTIKNRQSFRAYYIDKNGTKKKDHISNMALSNIAGYYDKPDRNLYNTSQHPPKCRTTHFTATQVDKWKQALPLLIAGDAEFKSLAPEAHKRQLDRANRTPAFRIANTAFSTITLNYNWRTACHKDKGDFSEGFGNLIVLEKDKCVDGASKYSGGYLGFPKWGVAVDVRQGDFLAMDVHQWHCNTEITGENSNKEVSKNDYGRLSIVCYLREGMIKCE